VELDIAAECPMSLFSLDGKTAVVTGGSRGIGAVLARGLLDAGASVLISARKADELAATAADLSQYGDVHVAPADLSDLAGVRSLAERAAELFPRLHILVNNAGATWGQPIDEFSESGWDRSFNVNVKAPFFLVQALLPQLRAAASAIDPARVVNIGSIDGVRPPVLDTYSYAASKAAVHHLTRLLALRLGPEHITANVIAPGPFPSEMTRTTFETMGDTIAADTPLRRIGEPDDLKGVVAFLAGRAGAYVTGAILPVDGGWSATS
jgi:NAD(P)-dependent dehydrogenase (short-subunit alcohol dehydrogenase family)